MFAWIFRLGAALLIAAGAAVPARAQDLPPPPITAEQAILVDHETGYVLFERAADERMPTASMSKVMTMYVVFEALRDGRLSLAQRVPVSESAWRAGAVAGRTPTGRSTSSFTGVEVGGTASVEDLIRGVIVQSGNDASVVLAEAVAGSEGAFAQMMNDTARRLGMTDSQFTNAHGLPDPREADGAPLVHYSTARDLARLGSALVRDFPQYLHYYGEREFAFAGISQQNRNPLVQAGIGDGLKTGHTNRAGYGLIGTGVRDGRRVMFVLNGIRPGAGQNGMEVRAREAIAFLEWGFAARRPYSFFEAGQIVGEVPVWLGDRPTVPLMLSQPVTLTLPAGARAGVRAVLRTEQPVPAPVAVGQRLGTVLLSGPGVPDVELPALAAEPAGEIDLFGRMGAAFGSLFGE